jgi:cell division protease FtsH
MNNIMNKQMRFNVGYTIAALFAIALIQYVISAANQIAPLPCSEFRNLLHNGKVDSVAASDRFIQGTLEEPLPGGQRLFFTTRLDQELAQELDKYGVRYTGQIESTLLRDIPLWWYIGRRMSSEAGGLGGGLMYQRQEQGQSLCRI